VRLKKLRPKLKKNQRSIKEQFLGVEVLRAKVHNPQREVPKVLRPKKAMKENPKERLMDVD